MPSDSVRETKVSGLRMMAVQRFGESRAREIATTLETGGEMLAELWKKSIDWQASPPDFLAPPRGQP